MQLNPHQYLKGARFAKKYPRIPVIINHLGCPTLDDLTKTPDVYFDGMAALAACPNTFIKISMLCYIDADWNTNDVVVSAVHRVISIFGPDRCFFASNFPVDVKDGWPAERLFPAFLKLAAAYDLDARKNLFHASAKRAYRIRR